MARLQGKKLQIGPITYEVIYDAQMQDGLLGTINPGAGEIKISTGQSEDAERVTLFHEAIHGILAHAGFTDHREEEIKALSYGFVDLLENNPHI